MRMVEGRTVFVPPFNENVPPFNRPAARRPARRTGRRPPRGFAAQPRPCARAPFGLVDGSGPPPPPPAPPAARPAHALPGAAPVPQRPGACPRRPGGPGRTGGRPQLGRMHAAARVAAPGPGEPAPMATYALVLLSAERQVENAPIQLRASWRCCPTWRAASPEPQGPAPQRYRPRRVRGKTRGTWRFLPTWRTSTEGRGSPFAAVRYAAGERGVQVVPMRSGASSEA